MSVWLTSIQSVPVTSTGFCVLLLYMAHWREVYSIQPFDLLFILKEDIHVCQIYVNVRENRMGNQKCNYCVKNSR